MIIDNTKVIVGSARLGEKGGYNQKAGNQTGRELAEQSYYNHSKGWNVFRAKNQAERVKLALCMKKAIANKNIGYDMTDRLTALNYIQRNAIKDYDVSKIKEKVEVDCSSLVRICVAYASGRLLGNFTTANLKEHLLKSGMYDMVKCNRTSELEVGDILCTKSQGHVVIVTSCGKNLTSSEKDTSKKIKKVYTGTSKSIVVALKELGVDSSFTHRRHLAFINGIVASESHYKGTYSQNVNMLKKLKTEGLLIS